ncbi:hypothetical protein [Parafrankia sp. FMc2]|uniref:hypothetical protein n=1 Tax=Parafrankia sp. FMc2 TaxID=3233196 RepID=UPI0034D61889
MTRSKPSHAEHAEQLLGAALPFLLGAGIFAVAFAHVLELALWAGQPRWAALIVASTGEAMAIAAGLKIRALRRRRAALGAPIAVLICALVWSGACNLATSLIPRDGTGQLTGDPGLWPPVVAVWVVIAFALVLSLEMLNDRSAAQAQNAPVVDKTTEPAHELVAEPTPASADPAPDSADTGPLAPVARIPRAATPAPRRRADRAPLRRTGTKKARLLALAAQVAPDDPRRPSALAADLAAQVGMTPNTARRILAAARRSTTPAGADTKEALSA